MQSPIKNQPANDDAEELEISETTMTDDAVEDDGTPVLDEADLEENGLTVEDAENIVWEEPKGSDKDK